ncbi:MAG: Mur ligase family protein [Terricaulis sp.]
MNDAQRDNPALNRFRDLFGPEFGHGRSFDLARLRAALDALGAPHEKLPPVVHVAGTNGKGSTIAFLRSIAEAAGLRVHAFTKPHLLHLRERFRIAGALATDDALIAAAERVAHVSTELTQFEAQVAAAFLLFSETPADLTLIEVGLGGRDDATNVIPPPRLAVITTISLDHQDALGESIEEIAAHKAGILKPGLTAIIARQPEAARAVIEAEAAHVGATLLQQGAAWDAFPNNGRLVAQTLERALDMPLPTLFGTHQVENAGLAIAALLALDDARFTSAAFAKGVAQASWPGRLQPLTRGVFAEAAHGAELWIDGGHNVGAAHALVSALGLMQRKRPAKTALIIGMRARKDWRAFVTTLAPSAARVVAVPLGDEGAAPEALAQCARDAGALASTAPDLTNAIGAALSSGAERILICGSLLLAGEALRDAGALD